MTNQSLPVKVNNFPRKWPSFVGRDVECNQVEEFLENSNNPILIVHGQRGVGKSSLVGYVANKFTEKFSTILWLHCSNALDLFERLNNKSLVSINPEPDVSEPTKVGQELIKILQNKVSPDTVSVAYKTLMELSNNNLDTRYLMVIDGFDEENSLTAIRNSESSLCNYIEEFVHFPNKAIITSRLRDNCFSDLGYDTIEIGLLREEDVNELIKKHFKNLDLEVLVNRNMEDTCKYVWVLSGGLAEFISRNIIPKTTQQEFLLGRDPELTKLSYLFGECYLLQREQPLDGNEYISIFDSSALEGRLNSLFSKDNFTEFILWKWLNLNITDEQLETNLGTLLGINVLDNVLASKLHASLRELYKNRFIAKRLHEKDDVKTHLYKQATKWIVLPVISTYLKQYWPNSHEYWEEEAFYYNDFVNAHINHPEIVEHHYKRIFDVVAWCYEHEYLDRLILLGISVAKLVEKLVKDGKLPKEFNAYTTLVDICQKTADVLEKTGRAENWRPLTYVLLILAKLYSVAKTQGSELLYEKAIEYAAKAYKLSLENEYPEWSDAAILTAKTYIYLGKLDQAEQFLEKVYDDKTQIKDDWALSAYLLATILRREENSPKASKWYQMIVDSVTKHMKVDIAFQSAIDAANFCSKVEDSSEAIINMLVTTSTIIKDDRKHVEKYPYLAVRVLAHCAAVYEQRQEVDTYKSLLLDAKQICKDFRLDELKIYEDINNRLIYLSQKELGVPLFNDLLAYSYLEPDMPSDFEDPFGYCPICRKRLISGVTLISCGSCGEKYHKQCLLDAGLSYCPTCNNLFISQREL